MLKNHLQFLLDTAFKYKGIERLMNSLQMFFGLILLFKSIAK